MNRRILSSRLVLPLALAFVAVGGGGCGAAFDPAEAAADEAAGRTREALVAKEGQEFTLVSNAFQDVPLAKNERAELQTMLDDASARHAGVKKARAAVVEALAVQIESGKIDRATLDPLFASVEAEIAKVAPQDRAAITRAHDLLDDHQRRALVEGIEDQIEEKKDAFKSRRGEIVAALGLTDDQKSKLRSIVVAHAIGGGRGGHGKKLLEAFSQPKLDVDAVAPLSEGEASRTARREMFLACATELLPELTPAQRTKAAALIRDKAEMLLGR